MILMTFFVVLLGQDSFCSVNMSKKEGIFGQVTKKLAEAWTAKLGSTGALLPESSVQVIAVLGQVLA